VWWLVALVGCAGAADTPPPPLDLGPVDYAAPIVLFVAPDSQEVAMLQARLGDDFFTVADDAMWYRSLAYDLLDSLRIQYIDVHRGSASFQIGGEGRRVDWSDIDRTWFALVYNGSDEPRIVADVDLREALSSFPR
jgi:hypothetical protein